MDLKLHVVNHLNRAVDREVPLVVTATGLTLGRNTSNDLVLDDPERVVSGKHARFDLRNGGLWLTDTSRNGTLLNNAPDPVPSHEAVALYDGDCLTIGPYEIRVRILDSAGFANEQAAGASSAAPLPGLEKVGATTDILDLLTPAEDRLKGSGNGAGQLASSHADDLFADASSLDDVLGGPASEAPPREAPLHQTPVQNVFYRPEQHQPLAEDYDLLNDVWVPTEGDGPKPAARHADVPKAAAESHVVLPPVPDEDPLVAASVAAPQAHPEAAPRPQPARRREPLTPRIVPPADSSGRELEAFLAGLGVGKPSDVQRPDLLLGQAGTLLRVLATGLTRTLMGRAQFKSELRLGVTTIRASENNPFKFSVGTDDLLDHLLFRPSQGFMPGPAAAQEAFEDIQAHEMAMTAGLQAALHSVLSRFDPDELGRQLGDPSGLDQLLPKGRKAKYWDLFTETYKRVSAEASEDIMELFGDAFARAYHEQMERLRAPRG